MSPTTPPESNTSKLRRQSPLGCLLRYGLAIVTVIAALGLRLALEMWFGPGLPTYITFYPAVMITALLAGFASGMLATALVCCITAYLILPPLGQFAIDAPIDRLGVLVFVFMGLFMSLIAELYRRNRDRASALEREAALHESREILRKQAELIDPVRAEIIAREMLRVLHEQGNASGVPAKPAGDTAQRVAFLAGAAVAVVGLLVMAGWILDLEPLKNILPGLASMKANSALCFLLAGAALALRDRRGVLLFCAGLVCAVSGLTLAEYITGLDFGLDQFLFQDVLNQHTIYPGRMAEATAVGFLSSGLSLLLLQERKRAGSAAQQALALVTGLIGVVAVLGYAYDTLQLYRFTGFSSMALHTAVSLILLAIGLIFARSGGLSAVLMTPGPGAQLSRRILPTAIFGPVVVGWLIHTGHMHGVYGEGMDTALFVLISVVTIGTMVLWTAHTLNRADSVRRRTETELRNLTEVMNHAHEPLIVREPGGVIRAWNRGAEALYGWPAADAIGRQKQILLHTDGQTLEEIDLQLENTGHWEGELVQTTRDGRRVTVESRQTARQTEDGQLLILESNRDITERKQAEEDLHKSSADLQSANTTLRESRAAAMNLMSDALEARQAAERAEKELQKLNAFLERRVAERTKDLRKALQDLQVETAERIQTAETLREKEQMLIQQSRQAAMGEMIGNIAHQWRQPLNTLGLYTQMLGTFYGTPDFNKEFLDNSIVKSMGIIKHMSKTIDDFRNYFRPEKEKTDFYVIEAIRSTMTLMEGNFLNPKITIDFVELDNPVINGYQNEYAQVFLNILNNARDAIIEREIADARIAITIFSENSRAVVTVADNAGGIPDGVIVRIFDPYFSTKGPQAGTGIGLFMSKIIIEKNMGGRLTVRNTDRGAEFRIEVENGTQD